MKKPQVRIIKEDGAQRIFIDGVEVTSILSFNLESDFDLHPAARLTITILCEIEEEPKQ